ncbi:MAG TPA: hypothetical protein VKF81_00445 [Blastocatellia bacterium]|nr:hypothetical protein [Blastocatellia bacterium]
MLIIVQAIAMVPSALLFLTQEVNPGGFPSSRESDLAFAALAYIILAATLLIFAKKLGVLFTRGLEDTNIQLDEGNMRVLQRVVFSVLGAYVLVYSLPQLLRMIAVAVLPPIRDDDGGVFRSLSRAQIPVEDAIRICADVALGLLLLVGWKTIVASIRIRWKKLLSANSVDEAG